VQVGKLRLSWQQVFNRDCTLIPEFDKTELFSGTMKVPFSYT